MRLAVSIVALGALIAGCATPPSVEPPSAAISSTPSTSPLAQTLEATYRERAAAFTRDRRWADALVQWELLALLRPDFPEYRDEIEQTRKRIHQIAAESLGAAEQARRRGNLNQATTQYLRALSVDRDNARAAQGLREIERERTRRAYLNRAPRTSMR
ncbi:MAG TPA: hypothetical protein VLT57_10575 [Bryobacteraceae bacterium]|nr:hypothetical protein [Bryobacteraceae bacterium]